MKANQKLLNERARFVLYDEYKFRLQKPEENYMGFDPPVIMLESGFCSDESGCDQYCFIRMGVKGHFFVEVGPYRLLSFSGQIIEAKYNNPPSEIWKALQGIPCYSYRGAEYFGIHIEKSYWPEPQMLFV